MAYSHLRAAAVILTLSVALAASAAAQVPVTAAWDPNTDALTAGYRVSVATSSGTPLAVLDVGSATSVVLPLPPGSVYRVAVRGYTAAGLEGPPSADALVDLATAPGAPTSVRAAVSGATASLHWSPPTSGGVALRYLVSVGTVPGGSNLLSEYPVGGALSISGALPDGVYYARLQAGNMVGIGPTSPDVPIRVGASPPGSPGTLRASWSGSTVQLTWSTAAGAATYVIEAGSVSGASNLAVIDAGNTRSFSAVVPPGTYYVRVRGVNTGGPGGPSNELVFSR